MLKEVPHKFILVCAVLPFLFYMTPNFYPIHDTNDMIICKNVQLNTNSTLAN